MLPRHAGPFHGGLAAVGDASEKHVSDWIMSFIDAYGYIGIAALMFAENVFPPIPSELIMPMAGFMSARGDVSPVIAVLAGTGGAILGSSIWYFAGRWVGVDRLKRFASRHGRFIALRPSEIDQADRWFCKHGPLAVLGGRLVPAVRTLISIPAGVTGMRPLTFFAYSAIGTALWSGLLLGIGMYLGERFAAVQAYVHPVSNGIAGIAAIIYLYRVATWRSDQRSTRS